MDEIICDIKSINIGYNIGNQPISILCYADDVVLMTEDEDGLQRLLFRLRTTAEKFNMEILLQKTQTMVLFRNLIRCKLALDGKTIEQVTKFKYLGIDAIYDRNIQNETHTQAQKAAAVSGCLRDIIWRNKHISIKAKVRIYKTCIRPIITYAAETRAETARTKAIIRTTKMKTLRAITNNRIQNRIRSSRIREMCDVQDIVKWTRTRSRKWRDHVGRMDQDRLARLTMMQKPNTRRPQGRPPKRWHGSWTSLSQGE